MKLQPENLSDSAWEMRQGWKCSITMNVGEKGCEVNAHLSSVVKTHRSRI
jgi:hypothetical protein